MWRSQELDVCLAVETTDRFSEVCTCVAIGNGSLFTSGRRDSGCVTVCGRCAVCSVLKAKFRGSRSGEPGCLFPKESSELKNQDIAASWRRASGTASPVSSKAGPGEELAVL